MKLEELKKYKKILILGYGKEGQATERFLKKFVPQAEIGIADKNIDNNYLAVQKNYELAIKSPGIPKKLVKIPYVTATNIFFANCIGKIIGVTGSKGKSTTASLIYSILKNAGKKVKLCGNIGKPMLLELFEPINNEDIFVCELSSYQLDDIRYSPHISVVTNLFPEHMNYHGSVDFYYQAKKNIIAFVTPKDYFIYNPKFEKLRDWAEKITCKDVPFEQELTFKIEKTQLRGEHNEDNIKASVTVAHLFDVKNETIREAVIKFKPLPHRLQMIGKYKKIIFYDDAISTTPESTIFAIKTLKNIGTIFLGGEDRGYKFTELVKTVFDYKIPNVVLFPDSGKKLLKIMKNNKSLPRILRTKSMEEAVKFAYQFTSAGQICLLSCASPSYSLWKNFEEKGSEFKKYVRKYG